MRAGVAMHHMAGIVTEMNMKTITKRNMMMMKAVTSKHLRDMNVRKMSMMMIMKMSTMMMTITMITKININELHQHTTTMMNMMMKTMAMNVEGNRVAVHNNARQVASLAVDLHQWIVKMCAA